MRWRSPRWRWCALLGCLASGAWAESSLLWQAKGTAGLRVRSLTPSRSLPDVATAELELQPAVGLSWSWADLQLTAGYSPSLFLRDTRQAPPRLLHRALVAGSARWPRATVALGSDLVLGVTEVDAVSPESAAPTSAEGVPGAAQVATVGLVPWVRSSSRLSLRATLDRRVTASLSGGYLVTGGLGTTALPLQQGPFGAAALRGEASRQDVLELAADGSLATFSTGVTAVVARGQGSWRRALAPQTTLDLSAGAGLVRQRAHPRGFWTSAVLPVGDASVTHRLGASWSPLSLRVTARLGPLVDRLQGTVSERIEGFTQLSWTRGADLVVTGGAGAAYALPGWRTLRAGERLLWGNAAVDWVVNRWVSLRADARLAWSEQPSEGGGARLSWLTGAWVIVAERDLAGVLR